MASGSRLQASTRVEHGLQAVPHPKAGARSPKPSLWRRWLFALAVLVAFNGCRQPTQQQALNAEVAWRRLGSWSGTGNTQTESFLFESGALRVRWETLNQQSGHTGQFRLMLLSAVSGRQLAAPVDQRGIGKGESLVAEIPHQAYILVESSYVDWTFTIDEATIGTKRGAS